MIPNKKNQRATSSAEKGWEWHRLFTIAPGSEAYKNSTSPQSASYQTTTKGNTWTQVLLWLGLNLTPPPQYSAPCPARHLLSLTVPKVSVQLSWFISCHKIFEEYIGRVWVGHGHRRILVTGKDFSVRSIDADNYANGIATSSALSPITLTPTPIPTPIFRNHRGEMPLGSETRGLTNSTKCAPIIPRYWSKKQR